MRHALWMRTLSLCAAAVLGVRDDTSAAEPEPTRIRAVLIDPENVTAKAAEGWKREGFGALVLDLDESHRGEVYRQAAAVSAAERMPHYYWIEVGRNPPLAREHPEWMSALGMHEDWRGRFPESRLPGKGEVAKAWPWVPIGYRDAFAAHLVRIERLVELVPAGYRGLLLNDVQGGPASCGCGNLQCRWAYDYGVAATAAKLEGPDIAARFVAEVRRRVAETEVIPVWAIECEEIDLPGRDRGGKVGTGLCGSVPCATTRCPREWAKQWSALVESHTGSVGILAIHGELGRSGGGYGKSARWVSDAVDYVEQTTAKHGGRKVARSRLWVVVQGYGLGAVEVEAAEHRAGKSGAGAVVVARRRIDQSYEPRIIAAKLEDADK